MHEGVLLAMARSEKYEVTKRNSDMQGLIDKVHLLQETQREKSQKRKDIVLLCRMLVKARRNIINLHDMLIDAHEVHHQKMCILGECYNKMQEREFGF